MAILTDRPLVIHQRSFTNLENGRVHLPAKAFAECGKKFRIARAGRRGAKTTTLGRIAVEGFLKTQRVLYATPTSDQIQRFWMEITRALDEPIQAGVFIKNETLHTISRPGTEQRIRAKTAWNADTLRGDYADLLILDEFQLMNEDTWGIVGQPMLMDNNGDAIFVYTPPSLHSRSISKALDPLHAAKLFKEKSNDPGWGCFHWTSRDNPFISEEGISQAAHNMTELAYRQEILAEDLEEVPGALWKRSTLDSNRLRMHPDLARIVVGVDPPGGRTECGIVVAGKALCDCKGKREMHAFVLEDLSVAKPPDVWALVVVESYRRWKADCILGEKNYGGDMVKHTIKTADASVNYRDIQATRGKAVRAEPIAAMDEQGKIHHVGAFQLLEDELCGWVPGLSTESPNRLDARVWAITELMLGGVEWNIA